MLPTSSPAPALRAQPRAARTGDAAERTLLAVVVALPPVFVALLLTLWALATRPELSRAVASSI